MDPVGLQVFFGEISRLVCCRRRCCYSQAQASSFCAQHLATRPLTLRRHHQAAPPPPMSTYSWPQYTIHQDSEVLLNSCCLFCWTGLNYLVYASFRQCNSHLTGSISAHSSQEGIKCTKAKVLLSNLYTLLKLCRPNWHWWTGHPSASIHQSARASKKWVKCKMSSWSLKCWCQSTHEAGPGPALTPVIYQQIFLPF